MSTRYYPIYQRGNPQLRVFLPNFWMKIVKPDEPLPPNMVLFQTSIEMTKYDVRNYLEKIYKVPVVDVKTTIKMGKIMKSPFTKGLVKDDDYKEALVYLPKDYKFEFPVIGERVKDKDFERYKLLKEEYRKRMQGTASFIPKWFTAEVRKPPSE